MLPESLNLWYLNGNPVDTIALLLFISVALCVIAVASYGVHRSERRRFYNDTANKHVWRQTDPVAQYVVLTWALEGHLDNVQMGIEPEKNLREAQRICEELVDLQTVLRPYLSTTFKTYA